MNRRIQENPLAIQHKDCPHCGTTVGNYIIRCECGFSFENLDDTDPTQRLEAMAEEERLYEDYLAARAKQAIADAAEARSGALSAPGNYYWETLVEQTENARDVLMAELYRQKLRNSEILTAIEQAKSLSKRKVQEINPDILRHKERSPTAPLPTSRSRAVKPAAAPDDNIPAVLTVPASSVAKHRASNPASRPDRIVAIAPVDNLLAPRVALDQSQRQNAALALDIPSTKTSDASAYTAKLEEILSSNKSSAPVAATDPITPGPEARQASQLAAAVKRAARLVVAIDTESFVTKNTGDLPSSASRPEDRLEHDSKAIRMRAFAMAERLLGAADASTQIAKDAGPVEPFAAKGADAMPANDVAAKPEPDEITLMQSPPAAVEPGAVVGRAVVPFEANQAEKSARAESLSQAHDTYPPRPACAPLVEPEQAQVGAIDRLAIHPAPGPYIEDRPSAIFRALQAAKADKIIQAARAENKSETKHCPFCSATHSGRVDRCGCGYVFEERIELPELMLSRKERIELLDDGIQIRRPKPAR